MPIFVIPGNHDTRRGLRNAFKDHQYLPQDGPFIHYVIDDYPLRFIGLDTTIPDHPEGVMCDDRLRWLDLQLKLRPTVPTVLFMHHPPIEIGIKHMDLQNCRNAEAIGALIQQHPQVIHIVCGHVHRPVRTQWYGTTVTIAPSASHFVALNLQQDSAAELNLEPPVVQLYQWQPENQTPVSHLSCVGSFDGPHRFYDKHGKLNTVPNIDAAGLAHAEAMDKIALHRGATRRDVLQMLAAGAIPLDNPSIFLSKFGQYSHIKKRACKSAGVNTCIYALKVFK